MSVIGYQTRHKEHTMAAVASTHQHSSIMSVRTYEHNGEQPLNREPPIEKLISSFLTTEDGYDRNHGAIPVIDAQTHRVTVEGAVRTPLSLTLADLQALPQHTVICALQCAGNRRHTMRTELNEVSGIDWFDGAVMNCKWRGPCLRDVLLLKAGGIDVDGENAHVAFACHQNPCQEDEWYGASVPLSRVMSEDADILLALEMNDASLTPNHGFPVRVVTPGVAGARSVKWLDRITVQAAESPNHYQQRDYKILPPDIDSPEKADDCAWSSVPALQDMPVNSVIGMPASGAKVQRDAEGKVEVKGYALPAGSSGPVVKVEVSGDGGSTWRDAEMLGVNEHYAEYGASLKWAWRLWRAKVEVEAGKGRTLLSRATDRGGNTQEERCQWNLRGCAYNGYGEVKDLEIV